MIAAVLVVGLLVFLVGFLVWRSGARAKARTGSWTGSELPVFFTGVALVTGLTAAEALAGPDGVAAVAVAGFVTALGWAVWRRHAQGAVETEPPVPVSPPELDELTNAYRFRDEPERLKAIVKVGPFAILLGGTIATSGGQLAAILIMSLFTLSVVAGVVIIFARRHRHQSRIIASVEGRAGTLPPDELRELVKHLELEHGRFEMRRLRRLVS